eukprot:TRINITY_DN36517_c0_g1_i1.p1 TRINITY_DN36517_c0_g1~~TRINITY_DN36517_c0_g1_i1.p1  ORF type:complete len:249 (-),score=43.37 TRINITY_DN36517_c0_g1_i1:99-752(-)
MAAARSDVSTDAGDNMEYRRQSSPGDSQRSFLQEQPRSKTLPAFCPSAFGTVAPPLMIAGRTGTWGSDGMTRVPAGIQSRASTANSQASIAFLLDDIRESDSEDEGVIRGVVNPSYGVNFQSAGKGTLTAGPQTSVPLAGYPCGMYQNAALTAQPRIQPRSQTEPSSLTYPDRRLDIPMPSGGSNTNALFQLSGAGAEPPSDQEQNAQPYGLLRLSF